MTISSILFHALRDYLLRKFFTFTEHPESNKISWKIAYRFLKMMETRRLLSHPSAHQDSLQVRTINLPLPSYTPIIIPLLDRQMSVKMPISSPKYFVKKIGSLERSVNISMTMFIVARKHVQITTLPMSKCSSIFITSSMVRPNASVEKKKSTVIFSYMAVASKLSLINTATNIAKFTSDNSSKVPLFLALWTKTHVMWVPH